VKTFLRKAGLCIGIAGGLLFIVSVSALLMGPTANSTPAEDYQDLVAEEYNKLMKDVQESLPGMPAFQSAKTRAQMHRENSIFGMIVGGVLIIGGFFLNSRIKRFTK
jgi:hypothetical protein